MWRRDWAGIGEWNDGTRRCNGFLVRAITIIDAPLIKLIDGLSLSARVWARGGRLERRAA